MQIFYLNTTTGDWFDRDGASFREGMPQVAFQSHEQIKIYTVTESPNSNDIGAVPQEWRRDTQWAEIGASAQITVDDDFIHKLRGTLKDDLTAESSVATVTVMIPYATPALIPSAGVLTFYNSVSGSEETVAYTSRTFADVAATNYDNSAEVTFTLQSTSNELAGDYPAGSVVDAPQAPYCYARMNTEESAPGDGEFLFDLTVDSQRLRDAMLYDDVASLGIKGMELLFYTIGGTGNVPVRSFICETFAITGTLGDIDYSAPLPEDEAGDRAYEIIASIVAAGVELQISANGEDWQNYTENSNLSNVRFVRWRNKTVGGAWSPAVPLIPGADGKSAYQVAVDEGFEGSIEEWMESLVGRGEPGKSAYEVAQDAGYIGSIEEWLESLKGAKGDGLGYDASGESLLDRTLYDDRPAGFKYAYASADQANYRTILFIYTKLSDAYADWSEALQVVFYGASKPEVTSIRPITFTPPEDTSRQYKLVFAAPQDATVAQVCIDTEEGEVVLPYYSALGVRKIVKVGGFFNIFFGESMPAYASGKVYLTQMVAADKSSGGGSGDIGTLDGTMYYGYLPSAADFQSVTAITADMLEADSMTAVDASAIGSVALGNVPAGSFTVVLIPAASVLTAKKDDGFGGKVAFELDNGVAGSGANGATVTIGDADYKVYGEFNLVSGATTVYIEQA